jgi:tetratricopeptide (TPR) repeat protein
MNLFRTRKCPRGGCEREFTANQSAEFSRTRPRNGVGLKQTLALLTLAFCFSVRAVDETNSFSPITARDFYNAGTKLLTAKKFADAEKMFQTALAAQDERVQPAAVYNLGHARFAAGVELLKKGPDAQKVAAQGGAALTAGDHAIGAAESALAENNLDKMIAAYIEGRGARHELREAEKAVRAALETYGKTLQKWQRAADDFKGAAELNPADTNAARNAEIVERGIAKLVDSLRKMQEMAGMMGKQKLDLGKLLSKLKGQIPAPNAPPGAAGDDDEEDVKPDSLAGQKENASRNGDQMQVPLSPDQAGQILDGLSLDGSRRLPMSDKEGRPPKDKNGRNW